MPIRQRKTAQPHPRADELRSRLLEEWREPNESHAEPIIIEENAVPSRPIHIYVIWSDWAELSQRERSEIIMDTYQDLRGAEASLRVTVAMGLTPDDAQRLNIQYE
ncbi:MAG: hypothetical protein KAY37_12175 [Phycisphaerae bacterium]|nr:hypothetical protein [Phycisphaerae bacterium]